jgi:hypothetical protein
MSDQNVLSTAMAAASALINLTDNVETKQSNWGPT